MRFTAAIALKDLARRAGGIEALEQLCVGAVLEENGDKPGRSRRGLIAPTRHVGSCRRIKLSVMEPTDLPAAAVTPGNLRPTWILDHASDRVQAVVRRVPGPRGATRGWLQAAYRLLRDDVRPVYTVDELQPTSVTLAKGQGSCSQRFACLESLARAAGIGTRVRGLWVAGRFWNPRFPLAAPFIPSRILLAWPQFYVDGAWTGVESLFELPSRIAERNPLAFANDGETLFDAIDHLAIDFEGTTAACGAGGCDLSGFVVGEAGLFESRDELFAGPRLFQHTVRGRVFELLYGGRRSH